MINYVIGDATFPEEMTEVSSDRPAIIAHCCNNKGGWGKGFVVALSNRWPEPEANYRAWYNGPNSLELGAVSFAYISGSDISVANIIGQEGYRQRYGDRTVHVDYDALRGGLESVYKRAAHTGATVHMPRIGCGLAGGTWGQIEPILESFEDLEVETFVYDLP